MLTLQLDASVLQPIQIKGEDISQTKTAKLLSVTVDNHLNFTANSPKHTSTSPQKHLKQFAKHVLNNPPKHFNTTSESLKQRFDIT